MKVYLVIKGAIGSLCMARASYEMHAMTMEVRTTCHAIEYNE